MTHMPRHRVCCLVLSVLLFGCTDRQADSGSIEAASSAGASSDSSTDSWLGQWNGPEGTFLRIAGAGAGADERGKYEVTIKNLDGPRNFQASAVGGQIQFERNGLKESIRSTNGTQTGMKWLADKTNCLTVRAGEGYCRD